MRDLPSLFARRLHEPDGLDRFGKDFTSALLTSWPPLLKCVPNREGAEFALECTNMSVAFVDPFHEEKSCCQYLVRRHFT